MQRGVTGQYEITNVVGEQVRAFIPHSLPLSNRLIREMHAELLPRGRGSEKSPGEFRRTQNRIGGTRPGNAHFVPPPVQRVEDCMAALERFLHDVHTPTPRWSKRRWRTCSSKQSIRF